MNYVALRFFSAGLRLRQKRLLIQKKFPSLLTRPSRLYRLLNPSRLEYDNYIKQKIRPRPDPAFLARMRYRERVASSPTRTQPRSGFASDGTKRHWEQNMKLRCREGDMALIIKEMPGCDRNIGRAVIVQGPVITHPEHGPSWLIEPVSPEPWAVYQYGGSPVWVGTISFKSLIEHPDEWLLPLRPEDEVYRQMLEEEDPHIVRITKDKIMRRHAFLREIENLDLPGYTLPTELDEDAKAAILGTWKRLKESGKDAQSLVRTGRSRA